MYNVKGAALSYEPTRKYCFSSGWSILATFSSLLFFFFFLAAFLNHFRQVFSVKKVSINPLFTTCPATNHRQIKKSQKAILINIFISIMDEITMSNVKVVARCDEPIKNYHPTPQFPSALQYTVYETHHINTVNKEMSVQGMITSSSS